MSAPDSPVGFDGSPPRCLPGELEACYSRDEWPRPPWDAQTRARFERLCQRLEQAGARPPRFK